MLHSMIEYFTSRNVFVNLLTVLLIGVGGYAALTLNKEAFPNVDFDLVVVTVVYPGASPQEVEKYVTNPLEESIKEVNGIEEYRSSSIESRAGITVKIDPDEKDTTKVINDIRSAVERTEDLPEDAKKPIILEMTSANTPVLEIALSSKLNQDGTPVLSYGELRKKAEILEKKILNLDSIARVQKTGWRDAEIHVNVDPVKMEANYISLDQIAAALRNRNLNLPGGEIKGEDRNIVIRTIGEYSRISEIEDTFIRSNDQGKGIRIRDVASVKEDFVEEDIIQKTRGLPSIALTAVKRESADVIQTVDEIKEITGHFTKTNEKTVKTNMVNDISFFVKRRLGVLMTNGITGLILVVASIFFFLGWRTSLMVALG
ncbi:MAG: efflux RND transporter permease subunit, partial [Spirochaetia bacterium]|nr:efflux RND transporter permease subunit [Spirochaetia bacterium]